MKLSSLALSPIPLTLLAVACGGLDPVHTSQEAAQMPTPPVSTAPSAGNVGLGIAPDRDAAAIRALRARGRAGLDELLAAYDRAPDGAGKAALAATIDLVAAQRYATVSRLYWHTELGAALAEARDTGKPILSLRMLGRLDEDLSCANSRFFRTILYPDPSIAKVLREKFVLHWSSERPVPRVTIDFGDGRTIERTVTGNSIHYVLDATGAPIDALPGLYAPSVFGVELDRALALNAMLAGAKGDRRAALIRAHHAERSAAVTAEWQRLGSTITFDAGAGRVLRGTAATSALARAQRATMSKAMVEVPEIAQVDLAPDPRAMLPDVAQWAVIGQALYGIGEPPATTADAAPRPRRRGFVEPAAPRPLGILSKPARALIAKVMEGDGGIPPAELDAAVARLEQTVLADTAINELQLRPQIRARFVSGPQTFDELNRDVYADVFATPAEDAWLGLLRRDVYSGIPGDGVVVTR
jgi:hypothetical protein